MALVYDEFDDASIGAHWTKVEAAGGSVTEQNGRMEVEFSVLNHWEGAWNPHGVYQLVSGNFDVYTRVTNLSFFQNFQTASLDCARADQIKTLTRVARHWSNSNIRVGGSTINGAATYDNAASVATEVWFRTKRVGNIFTLYFAESDPSAEEDWTTLAPANQWEYGGDINIWLHGSSPNFGVGTAYFQFFRSWPPGGNGGEGILAKPRGLDLDLGISL